jgi:hypothetical protein
MVPLQNKRCKLIMSQNTLVSRRTDTVMSQNIGVSENTHCFDAQRPILFYIIGIVMKQISQRTDFGGLESRLSDVMNE